MKSIKTLAAAMALGTLALLGVTGCAGPRYQAAAPEGQFEEASAASSDSWVDSQDYSSLTSGKAWPASAPFHSLAQ